MEHPSQIAADAVAKAFSAAYGTKLTADKIELDYCSTIFGDFACNIALRQAADLKKTPIEIGKVLVSELKNDPSIDKAELAGPGFINITLKADIWCNYAEYFDHFGQSKLKNQQSIQLEFISANPTGPLVLTNAWQGYYGDILANIYASQGYNVAREYYLNDGGNQITALGNAIAQALGKKFLAEEAKNLYRGEYINNVAKTIVEEYGQKQRVLDTEPAKVGKRAAEIILERYIKLDLERLGVHFDTIFSETTPDTKATLARLEEAGMLLEKDGAVWLNGQKIGLEQDEVLVRSYDKGETYFLKDIAYQLGRLEERNFDNTITIVGPDHHGQAIRLVKTLESLGHSNFRELSTQTIRLIKDGKEFKMSKRAGNYILLNDFLDEVPSEAARFYFGLRDTNSHMDFDIDVIKEKSAKNPVYYTLYAYARACSIRALANEAGIKAAEELSAKDLSSSQRELLRQLSQIPEILASITQNHKVHLLLHATSEVARCFHEWYEQEKVIGSDDASHKLAFVDRFCTAYEAIFAIIGVTLLEKM
jgi:arginyl-tRNA synthetase